jgi:hypothetical protein
MTRCVAYHGQAESLRDHRQRGGDEHYAGPFGLPLREDEPEDL